MSTIKRLNYWQRGPMWLVPTTGTGIPAWERAYPDRPMEPGKVKLQEFEYIRHGGCCLIANWEVAMGKVLTDVPPTEPPRMRLCQPYCPHD